jgi:hypothetical protein
VALARERAVSELDAAMKRALGLGSKARKECERRLHAELTKRIVLAIESEFDPGIELRSPADVWRHIRFEEITAERRRSSPYISLAGESRLGGFEIGLRDGTIVSHVGEQGEG